MNPPKLTISGAVVPREFLEAAERTRSRHLVGLKAAQSNASDLKIDIGEILESGKAGAMVFMMSRRMISDRLLKSDRYMSLPPRAQNFYLHTWLIADDFGLLLWSPLGVRECFKKRPGDAELKSLMRKLESADLIRPYPFDGVTFAFIPNFDQRLQKLTTECPLPPPELYEDDEEATKKFSENKSKFKKSAGIHGDSRGIRARSEVKGREEKGSEVEGKAPVDNSTVASNAVQRQPPDRHPENKPEGQVKDQGVRQESAEAYAARHGIMQLEGEAKVMWHARVMAHRFSTKTNVP
jgi:hypothetical protein